MRTFILVALFCAARHSPCQTVSTGVETNFACVERLQVPTYPLSARSVDVEGTVDVSVRLSPAATIQEIESKFEVRVKRLTPSVEAAVRNAKFNSDCGGRVVRLKFVFELAGQRSVDPKETVTFEAPNRFRITSEPQQPILN